MAKPRLDRSKLIAKLHAVWREMDQRAGLPTGTSKEITKKQFIVESLAHAHPTKLHEMLDYLRQAHGADLDAFGHKTENGHPKRIKDAAGYAYYRDNGLATAAQMKEIDDLAALAGADDAQLMAIIAVHKRHNRGLLTIMAAAAVIETLKDRIERGYLFKARRPAAAMASTMDH